MRLPGVAGKIVLDYVIRRLNALSAGLKSRWGLDLAETPFSAISRSNWSPESAEVRPHLIMRLVRVVLVPCGLEHLNQRKKDLTISEIISRAACLAELTSNPKSFSNCPDLHGGVPGLPGGKICMEPALGKKGKQSASTLFSQGNAKAGRVYNQRGRTKRHV